LYFAAAAKAKANLFATAHTAKLAGKTKNWMEGNQGLSEFNTAVPQKMDITLIFINNIFIVYGKI
jgi:hypothetical protein